jgi:hypothetical protein
MNGCLEPLEKFQVHFVAVEEQNKLRIKRKDQKLVPPAIAHPIFHQT